MRQKEIKPEYRNIDSSVSWPTEQLTLAEFYGRRATVMSDQTDLVLRVWAREGFKIGLDHSIEYPQVLIDINGVFWCNNKTMPELKALAHKIKVYQESEEK